MTAFVKDPNDSTAIATVAAKEPSWNGMRRTTCVATMLDGGHATNALPQRARANVNCRIFPGVTSETVRSRLEEVVADPEVKVTTLDLNERGAPPPPLTPAILGPLEKLTQQFYPGVPVVPMLQPGATDGRYLIVAGIPTYGLSGYFMGPDIGNIHGLNEYIGVDSLLQGREFMYRLVKLYGDAR
jgi:acetylornithine deacetylase/succinyl-diaminopimelate desuccinylase-like protein